MTREDLEVYDRLSNKMMEQLLLFEGKDPLISQATSRKTPGVKPTASVLAIGKRVKAHI